MMDNKTITRKTTDGLFWNTLQKLASKGLQFVFSILIARILIPEQYGVIAIANLFISLSDVLIDSGFSKALLRKEHKTLADYSTVFWFNLAVSVLLYWILFFAAPRIGSYYGMAELSNVIRIISLSLVINAICGIQSLHLVAEMKFKIIAILETIAMCIGGAAGLFCAIKGMGVWALVTQTLAGCISRTALIWAFCRFRLSFVFSFSILKDFFSFGSRLLLSEFAGRLYGSIFTLTIGKNFSSAQLGYYGKADAFASAPSSIVSGPLSFVTFPAIAQIQDEKERMRESLLHMVSLSSLVVFPVFIGLIAVADSLVPVLLTDKWDAMIPLFKVLTLAYLFNTIQVIPQNILLVLGYSSSILRIQLSTKALGLLLLFPLCRVSIISLCWLFVVVGVFSFAMTLYYVRQKAEYSSGSILKCMMPSCLISIAMFVLVTLIVKSIPGHQFAALFAGIALGIVIYLFLTFITNRRQLLLLISLLRQYF